MQEEIFGPLLPVLSYRRLEEALDFVRSRPKPLALYTVHPQPCGPQPGGAYRALWGRLRQRHHHAPVRPLPALWRSGAERMGSYHGKRSFDTFTHEKSVLVRGSLDLPIRYQPYTPLGDKLVRAFLR